MNHAHSNNATVVRRIGAIAAALVAGPLAIAVATPAAALVAQTRYVATTGNNMVGATPNACTIKATPCLTIEHAVDEAASGDTVSVGSGAYAESISINKSLNVVGAGSGHTTITGDGESDPAIKAFPLDEGSPPTVTVRALGVSGLGTGLVADDSGLAVTDSTISQTGQDGIEVESGSTLTLTNTSVVGSADDGVVVLDSTLDVTDSAFSGSGRSGIEARSGTTTVTRSRITGNANAGVLAGIDDSATVTIADSTIDQNVGAGAAAGSGAIMTITRSTVSNTTGDTTQVDPLGGGLLALHGGQLTAREDTIYGNTSFGIGLMSAATNPNVQPHDVLPGSVTVENSTITGTTPGSSSLVGGLATDTGTETLMVTGTIDAANKVADCGGTVTDGGYNVTSDTTCTLHATGSKQHVAAELGQLANNGGPTKTVSLGVHSAARNQIPFGKAGCVKGATDQRGKPRREPTTGRCDIGAVEMTVVNPKLKATISGHKSHGVYHGVVTVTYHCKAGTAHLTKACPKPTHLSAKGTHHIKKTIHAIDGGSTTLTLKIRIA